MQDIYKRLKAIEYKLCLLESGGCIEILYAYKDIVQIGRKRFIYIISDEMNNADSSLYLYTGIELKFLLTVA